jgi:hypothetical protein
MGGTISRSQRPEIPTIEDGGVSLVGVEEETPGKIAR